MKKIARMQKAAGTTETMEDRAKRIAEEIAAKTAEWKRFAETFQYEGGSDEPRDTQKAILSIAFLLEWGSEIGNNDLPGMAAYGLSYLLRKCAENSDRLHSIDRVINEVRECGGDPSKLFKAGARVRIEESAHRQTRRSSRGSKVDGF